MLMKWMEVCEHYPDRIVLVEALESTSINNIRTIEDMSIIAEFNEDLEAWHEYKKLHKNSPDRELYIFHTSKEKAEVKEHFLLGLEIVYDHAY